MKYARNDSIIGHMSPVRLVSGSSRSIFLIRPVIERQEVLGALSYRDGRNKPGTNNIIDGRVYLRMSPNTPGVAFLWMRAAMATGDIFGSPVLK